MQIKSVAGYWLRGVTTGSELAAVSGIVYGHNGVREYEDLNSTEWDAKSMHFAETCE